MPPGDEIPLSTIQRVPGIRHVRRQRVVPLRPKRIVIALEPKHPSREAVAWGLEIARIFRSKVSLITVFRSHHEYALFGPEGKKVIEPEEEVARRVLVDTMGLFEHAGMKVDFAIRQGSAIDEIVRHTIRGRADLVIVGSHGYGATARALLGSVADSVKNLTPASVLIARTMPRARHIVAGLDGSALGRRATGFALRMMRAHQTDLLVLHAVDVPKPVSRRTADRWFASAAKDIRLLGWKRPGVQIDVRQGPASKAILAAANARGANLIVMGSRGMSPIKSLVVGSSSAGVAHKARASVLLVKA